MKPIGNLLLVVVALLPASASGQVCAKQIIVPEYPPIARAARITGTVDIAITIGARGQVLRVKGSGSSPMLVQQTKENAKSWIFCEPKRSGIAHVQL
ncbi:MAG: TonB family protein, partial [Terriglobales bacterium]